MNRYTLSVIAALATACLATGALAQQGPPQGPPNGLGVQILNTPSVNIANTPLAVTGNVTTSGSVSLAPGSSVTINTSNGPVSVSNGDEPGRIAYQSLQNQSGCNSNLCLIEFPVVPVGKRLVVQSVSGNVGITGTPKSLVVNLVRDNTANSGVASFFGTVAPSSFTGSTVSVFDHQVLFYIDAGGKPTVLVNADAASISSLQVTLSGYLLDCTPTTCKPIAQ